MTRFYFNIYNDEVTTDDEGIDCADADAARKRAVYEARILASDSIQREGRLNLDDRIVVVDDLNAEVVTVWFRDAIDVRP